ncbi:hypothetical protein [Thalassiella azotivora]
MDDVVTTTRCPSCSARLPDGAAWCTLCYVPLPHAAGPAATDDDLAGTRDRVGAADQAGSPGEPGGRRRGRHAAPSPEDAAAPVVSEAERARAEALADEMLLRMAAERGAPRLVREVTGSTPRRLLVGVVGLVVVGALVLGLMAVAGTLG